MKESRPLRLRPLKLFTLPGVLDALLFWSLFACASTLMLWLLTSTIKTILREMILSNLQALTVTAGEVAVADLRDAPFPSGPAGMETRLRLKKRFERMVERNPDLLGVSLVRMQAEVPELMVSAGSDVAGRLPLEDRTFRGWLEKAGWSQKPSFSPWSFIEDTALPLFTTLVRRPEYSFQMIETTGRPDAGPMIVVLVFNAPEIQEKFLRVDRIAATVISLAIIIATLLSLFVRRRSMQRQEAIDEKLAVLELLGQRDAILADVAAAADEMVTASNLESAITRLMDKIRVVLQVRDAYTCLSSHLNRLPEGQTESQIIGGHSRVRPLLWEDLELPELAGWRSRFSALQPVVGPLENLSTSERICLKEKDIPNLAAVPVMFESVLMGFIVVVEDDASRTWESGLLDTLRLAGDLIGSSLAKREQEKRLLETGKMQALGRMAAGVAHEFNNLLHIISGNLRLLVARGVAPSADREMVDKIIETTERGSRIVEQLLNATRQGTPDLRPILLNDVVQKTVFLAQSTLRKDVKLILTLDKKIPMARLDAAQIQQVILNLLINAHDAISGAGEIVVATGSVMQRFGDGVSRYVYCVVQDTGVGIPGDNLDHLFDPFFTTKPPGKGTGLGLSTSRGILEQHQGSIIARNVEPHGAAFTFYLPAWQPEPGQPDHAEPHAAAAAEHPHLQKGRVLVADDEPLCRDVLRAILDEQKMVCLEAVDGAQAVALAQQESGAIDWVVTDWSMPGLHGHELVRELRRILPRARIVITSGFLLDADEIAGIDGVVLKPFNPEVLVQKMVEISERRPESKDPRPV
jgi:signal transduction histidine kinase